MTLYSNTFRQKLVDDRLRHIVLAGFILGSILWDIWLGGV